MTVSIAAAGVLLGALVAAAQLALTRWRARLLVGGRKALPRVAYLLGLAVAGGPLLVAAPVGPACVAGFVLGLFVTRTLVLARLSRVT